MIFTFACLGNSEGQLASQVLGQGQRQPPLPHPFVFLWSVCCVCYCASLPLHVGQSGSPEVEGQVEIGGAAPEERQQDQEGEEAVDCVTAKAQTTLCDVACPVGLSSARTIVGHEVPVLSIVCGRLSLGKRPMMFLIFEDPRVLDFSWWHGF